VRSRGHEAAVYVDLHVQVAPEMSTAESHAIAHDVQHRLKSEMPVVQDVVVHVEPEDGAGVEVATVLPALRALAAELELEIHDIAAHWVDGAVYVEAHITLDGNLTLREAHNRVSQLERASQETIEHLAELVTHIEPMGMADELGPGLSGDAVRSAVLATLDGLHGCGTHHDIRVHPEGENWAVTLHCQVDPDLLLSEAHEKSSEIEVRLRNEVPRLSQVTVHMEPLSEPAQRVSDRT
jgi:divalent metal cation (Fe/Co/Zn/Cd) transporter